MQNDKLLNLASKLHRSKVLVLGDLMLDEWIWGKVSRISPEAPVPVVAVERRTYTPGGASNVAANLRSLGAATCVLGIVGKDEAGRKLKDQLKKRGANIQGIVSVANRPTTLKTRIIAHNQQVVRADFETRGAVDEKIALKLFSAGVPLVAGSDAILFSDYNKGFMAGDFVPKLISEARSKKKVLVAGAKPSNLTIFSGATLIIMNQLEAEQALNRELSSEKELKSAGVMLLNQLHTEGLIITRGEHGMAIFEHGKPMASIPSVASEVYDVSGAGDTVIAVATLALVAGATLLEAAILANHAAGVVVKKVGTATVTRKELEDSFEQNC